MPHYRTEMFPELVPHFHSYFRMTVQFGYASLMQPKHALYNYLPMRAFLAALANAVFHATGTRI
jgi:hypothetical protein